jgi:hypothetical protein
MTESTHDNMPMEYRERDGLLQGVNCPYGSIQIRNREGISTVIKSTTLRNNILQTGAFPCLGECCTIYPCERVRDFAEGKI